MVRLVDYTAILPNKNQGRRIVVSISDSEEELAYAVSALFVEST